MFTVPTSSVIKNNRLTLKYSLKQGFKTYEDTHSISYWFTGWWVINWHLLKTSQQFCPYWAPGLQWHVWTSK